MLVSELAFDLSTPEACFAAESAEDCFAALKVWRDTLSPRDNIPLSCAVAMICSNSNTAAVERMISRLSVLSMFTLISSRAISCNHKIPFAYHQTCTDRLCSTVQARLPTCEFSTLFRAFSGAATRAQKLAPTLAI